MPNPLVFISYSNLDEPAGPDADVVRWLTFVLRYLEPAAKRGVFDYFVDRQMAGGAEWKQKIEANLNACDIFVLLVSPNSMVSGPVVDEEIPAIRACKARGDSVEIYPIILEPTTQVAYETFAEFNYRPRDKSLQDHDYATRCRLMCDVADEIATLAATRSGRAQDLTAVASPALIDIDRLPYTGYEKLVGRDVELAALDAAWDNPKINIYSLVAEGGAGKSALVEAWLTLMRDGNYRGAQAVLGWSFYSQGSKERATSSETFLDWALKQLGAQAASTSAEAKGEAIAKALSRRRALLVLDGVEPLQHGPGPQAGILKDPGLRTLLRLFAAEAPASGHGLIVVTSRAEVEDLGRWLKTSAPTHNLDALWDQAGAQLLRDNGASGTERDLRAAARDFGGHPLALTLLAHYVRETQNGDINRRDRIRGLLADADNPRHDHAKRVMESLENEWLAAEPLLLHIMYLVGLFDRPATSGCLNALRREPAIAGLTEPLVGLDEDAWRRAVTRLRAVRLHLPVDKADPDALDAHPLTREWFGERLHKANEPAWKEAHGRLYEHLRDTTKEGDPPPNLEALAPLYQAISHGCRAGRYQETLDDVYADRICRRGSNGEVSFYAMHMLGGGGADLAAISWFFATPFTTPAAGLSPHDRSWVMSVAAFTLRALGRLGEAVPVVRAALVEAEAAINLSNAAIRANNLSEMELTLGDVAAAGRSAAEAMKLADRSGDVRLSLFIPTTLADAEASAGRITAAKALFEGAEARQGEHQPAFPRLYSLQGYQFCDLLLLETAFAEARERATQTLEWAQRCGGSRLDRALDTLTSGRAGHGLVLTSPAGLVTDHQRSAEDAARRLDDAVAGIYGAGQRSFIPRGLLARAAFWRSCGDFAAATRDLDDVDEIAAPGQLRLFLCDLALERARVALWRRAGFAPLAEVLGNARQPPETGEAAQASLDIAKSELATAAKLIEDCGYHKRDAELAELQAVVRGERAPADLPPRV